MCSSDLTSDAAGGGPDDDPIPLGPSGQRCPHSCGGEYRGGHDGARDDGPYEREDVLSERNLQRRILSTTGVSPTSLAAVAKSRMSSTIEASPRSGSSELIGLARLRRRECFRCSNRLLN